MIDITVLGLFCLVLSASALGAFIVVSVEYWFGCFWHSSHDGGFTTDDPVDLDMDAPKW